jgi:mannosyl-glycoprotein endo-beta-N-acetylglucosaminidase
MKKRILAVACALILLLGLIPLAGAMASTSMYVYTSNGKSLNLRDYPSNDGNVIAQIPFGAQVAIDTSYVGSTWVHVTYRGSTGYCMSRYLTDYKPGPSPTATPAPTTSLYENFSSCYYTATVRPSSPGGFVHLRWAPSKSQPVWQDYYNGDEIIVIAQNGAWCQVYDSVNNMAGFMMASFLVSR